MQAGKLKERYDAVGFPPRTGVGQSDERAIVTDP
jgi:hypothetical protein